MAKGGDNSDEDLLGAFIKPLLDVVSNFFEMLGVRKVDIFFRLAGLLVEQAEIIIINVEEQVLSSNNDWSWDHITRVESALVDLSSEDVFGLENDLSGTVLTWLGGGGLSDLARETLDHDEGADLKSLGFDELSLRGTSISGLELFVFFVGHFKIR